MTGPVDSLTQAPVLAGSTLYQGRVFQLVAEDVDLGQAGVHRREFVRHPGAVAVLALDDEDRVLMIRQYRHPVRALLWELPAGLLDAPDEDPAAAAARELWEEADLVAGEYHVLVDMFASPGSTDEALRLFLARGTRPAPADRRHVRGEEEAGIVTEWVPLDDAVAAVLAGRVHNSAACAGVLAAAAARARGWQGLRPADAPWPEHPARRVGRA